jgi:hypothetical protein
VALYGKCTSALIFENRQGILEGKAGGRSEGLEALERQLIESMEDAKVNNNILCK